MERSQKNSLVKTPAEVGEKLPTWLMEMTE